MDMEKKENGVPEKEKLIEIKDLTVHYETRDGVVEAVNDVSFTIHKGETFGLVGETGAGKTTIALSIMGLLPFPPSHIIGGEIRLEGDDLLGKSKSEMRHVRGNRMSMIFQDPMTALNPVQHVGDQIAEVISIHNKCPHAQAMLKAIDMLKFVGIPEERYKDYPHQFSGGMKQRVVIAIALACQPDLIIADEPTTALDVTIQAQILEFIQHLNKENNASMLLITHDFGIVAETCDKCAVVYAGEIVEMGTVEDIFDHRQHPYTIGLFDSLPSLNKEVDRLKPISGLMANPMELPSYCSFQSRCEQSSEECKAGNPPLIEVSPGHFVRCFHCGRQQEGRKD